MRRFAVSFCVLVLGAANACATASAEDRFKGDGTDGGLVPDFSQRQGQEVKGICSAAAAADALWYLDQHGFGGLVDHTKADMPNSPWKDDAKKLVLNLADLIFGKSYMMGKVANGISGGVQKGIVSYLKNKAFDKVGAMNRPALTVRHRDVIEANYAWWRYYAQTDAFYPAIGDFSWRDEKGTIETVKDGKDRDIQLRHAMTAAGRDTTDEKTHVAMGWEDHPPDKPPYKKPPYADGETPFFDTYKIELTGPGGVDSKRMQLPNQEANLFTRYPADHITLDAIDSIENARVSGKFRTPIAPKALSADAAAGSDADSDAGQVRYEYEVENTSANDFTAKQFFLQIATPFDLPSVLAPSGWEFTLWDPKLTPEIAPSPPSLTDEGDLVDPEAGAWAPDFSGLLFYTLNDAFAVAPGATLAGFSFATDSIYRFSEGALFSGVSNTPVGMVNPGYLGSITEYGFVGGPVPVCEPSTCLLVLLLLPPLCVCRRRISV